MNFIKKHSIFIGILFAGALIRISYLLEFEELPFFTHFRLDGALYHEAGIRIAGGDWALGHLPFQMSPLYSYFVGIIYSIFGSNPWSVRIVQIFLGLLTIALIYGSAETLWGKKWARLAAILSVLYTPFIFYEMQFSVATLGAFLFALLCYLIIRTGRQKESWKMWLTIGVVWGLNVLARPNALLFVFPLLFIAIKFPIKNSMRTVSFLFLGLFVTIFPVTLRNYWVTNEFVLVTSSGGMNFFLGNGPKANGTFRVPDFLPEAVNAEAQFRDFKNWAEQEQKSTMTVNQADRFWLSKTIDTIKAKPVRWLKLLFYKFELFWNTRELENSENFSFHQKLSRIISLPLIEFGWISVFAFLGCILLFYRSTKKEKFIAVSAIVFCISNILFFILSHYRLPGIPILILAAVGALRHIFVFVEQRRWKPMLAVLIMALPISFVVNATMIPQTDDDEFFKLGYAASVQGKTKLSEWAYEKALELNPNHLSSHKNLAIQYQMKGQAEEALKHWKEVARIATEEKNTKEQEFAETQLKNLQKK